MPVNHRFAQGFLSASFGSLASGFVTLTAATVEGSAGITVPNGDPYRAMFTWVNADPIQDPLNTEAERDALIAFCQAQGVNLLFLDMYQYIAANNTDETKQGIVRNFIGDCTAAGITVYGLAGNTDWTTPAVQGFITTNIIGGLETYQDLAAADQKFAGFVFDNEYWVTEQDVTGALAQQEVLNGLFSAALEFPIGVFSAFYLMDNTETRAPILFNSKSAQDGEHLVDISDFVVVGTYRDDGDIAIAVGDVWYNYGEASDADIFMGAETIDVGNSDVTFFEENKAFMETELTKVATQFSGSSYQGIAVHSYDGWSALADS